MKTLTKLVLVTLLLSGLLWGGASDDSTPPVISLSDFKSIDVQYPAVSLVMPLRCGPEGSMVVEVNRYSRDPRPDDYLLMIRPDGKIAKLVLPEDLTTGWWAWRDYHFGPGGDIYVLTDVADEDAGLLRSWLIKFDKDGAYSSKTEIDLPIQVRRFAWLDRNTLIVSGMRPPKAPNPHVAHVSVGTPATVLVDHNGKYLKDVKGIEAPEKFESGILSPESVSGIPYLDITKEQRAQIQKYDDFSWMSRIDSSGLDGKAYIRVGDTNYVYIVGPDGTVTKRWTIESPEPYLQLVEIKVGDGLLAAWFQGENPDNKLETRFLLFDLATRKLWRQFRPSPKLASLLACHSRSSLTLLGAEDGRMQLRVVPIQ